MSWAYSYRELHDLAGMLCLGTDFPVEGINPMMTFHAATERTDTKGWPEGGFRPDQKLTPLETLRGMTIDCATTAFMEDEVGSLEIGKFGDFVVLDSDLLDLKKPAYEVKVMATFINGAQVFKR